MIRKILLFFLFWGGGLQLLAAFAVFFPFSWMAGIHDQMGIGALPDLPIINYLTRSLSALYAAWGALYLFIATDLDRYLPLLRFVAGMKLLLGAGVIILDILAGLPWLWTALEGPGLCANSVIILVLVHLMSKRSRVE